MKNFIIIAIIIGLGIVSGYSNTLINSLSFNHISKEDGLSDDLIFSIFQDSEGYIWIGTSNGLNRYDGYHFKTFLNDPDDPGSISHNVITGICEDKKDNLWLATYGGGISRFNRRTNSFRNFRSIWGKEDNNSSKIVNHISSDSKNRLWIATKENGLFLFDPESFHVRNLGSKPKKEPSLEKENIMSTFEDSSGNIWIATWGKGLYRYVESDQNIKPVSSDVKGTDKNHYLYIHSILEDPEKNLWLGTGENGLVRYDRTSGVFQSFGIEPERQIHIRKQKTSTIFKDPENNNLIWIGTQNGLYIYNIAENKFSAYKNGDTETGLSNKYVWSITRDRSGLLWIGTIGGGLNLEKRGSECFRMSGRPEIKSNSLNFRNTSAIHSDQSNPSILWIGTLGNGLKRVDLSSGESKVVNPSGYESNPMAKLSITSISPDPGNPEILYLGTNTGLNKYHSGENSYSILESPLDELKGFNSIFVSSLLMQGSSPRILWIGSFGKGLYKLDLDRYKLSNYMFQKEFENSSHMNRIYTIFRSPSDKNILWLGTNMGVARFDSKTGVFTIFDPEIETKKGNDTTILSIYKSEQQPGILWCGSRDKGLFKFNINSGSFEKMSADDGLPDNTIVSIAEEPRGNLWLGTLKGLSRFIMSTGRFRNFDKCEGLRNSAFNLNASHISTNGKIFIGGPAGIDCFSPERLNRNMTIPPIVITDLKIFGSSELPGMDEILRNDISTINAITLPSNYNTLTLSFAALDYTSPEKNQFSCRLAGLESDWKYLGTKNSIEYDNLQPGKYIFFVKGSNSDSVWNETGRKLTIIISASMIGSFWFWLIISFLVIFIAYVVRFLAGKPKRNKIPPDTTVEQLFSDDIITEREKEIIALILQGKSNKDIEDELFISLGTVKNHLYNIYKKLNIKSRTQLVSMIRSEEKP